MEAATLCRNAVHAALGILLLIAGCVQTVPFTDAQGSIIPGSIAAMENVTIGGLSQSIWFRGIAQSNPALILSHGGPGASAVALLFVLAALVTTSAIRVDEWHTGDQGLAPLTYATSEVAPGTLQRAMDRYGRRLRP